NRAEARMSFKLARITDLRVIQMGKPNPDWPLTLGFIFRERVVKLTRNALRIDVANQNVALSAQNAGTCRRLHSDLAQEHVDSSLAIICSQRAVAASIARQADGDRRG